MPVHQEINPRKVTPAQRARICERIRYQLELEAISGLSARTVDRVIADGRAEHSKECAA